jgi:hypothetical protein
MADMARSTEERERKHAEFIRRCTTNPVSRRVVEDLIPISVQEIVKQGIRLIMSHGIVVQAEARAGGQDGFLRISIPGAATSRTFRLVPLSQARRNMPVFDGTATWLAVDGHGKRVKTIYMCPVTRACGSRQDFNAKYLSQRLGKRRRLRLKGHRSQDEPVAASYQGERTTGRQAEGYRERDNGHRGGVQGRCSGNVPYYRTVKRSVVSDLAGAQDSSHRGRRPRGSGTP